MTANSKKNHSYDQISAIIKECNVLSTVMSKQLQTTYKGRNIFHNQLSKNQRKFSGNHQNIKNKINLNDFKSLSNDTQGENEPLIYGFIELKTILMNIKDLNEIDSLTILQPFLLVISTSSTSGYITNLALIAVNKFLFQLNILDSASTDYILAVRQCMVSLTHCRFEGTDQMFDDAVLLKVLELIQKIFVSDFGHILTDSQVYDVLQTVLSLACNKKRTEILRRAAESTLSDIVTKLMHKVNVIDPTLSDTTSNNNIIVNDTVFVDKEKKPLIDDLIGSSQKYTNLNTQENENANTSQESLSKEITPEDQNSIEEQNISEDEVEEQPYGLPVVKDFISILVSLLSPEQSLKHNYSTKNLAFQLLTIVIEISGRNFPKHPNLMLLLSDSICKNLAYIFKNILYTKVSLLNSALQLFNVLCSQLGDKIELQLEFMFTLLLDFVIEDSEDSENKYANSNDTNKKHVPTQTTSLMKEMIIDSISLLWSIPVSSNTHKGNMNLFTSLFIRYDCRLDRSDLAVFLMNKMCKLSLPEMANISTEAVPPTCLNGILSFIEYLYDSIADNGGYTNDLNDLECEDLQNKMKKNQFIKATESFNNKPKNGIPKFIEYGFIEDNDDEKIMSFLFEQSNSLNKKTLGEYLGTLENVDKLKIFIEYFNFTGLKVDEALRVMLTKFRLPGESQQIERVVDAFSHKYVKDQDYESKENVTTSSEEIPEDDYDSMRPDTDTILVLSYSIIMLNTDLHNPQIKKHMSFIDYSLNLKGCYNGENFPVWYLNKIYESIKFNEIVMPEEHHGNELWFDDKWSNIITSLNTFNGFQKEYSNKELLRYNRELFTEMAEKILPVLFEIFHIASDDYISSMILSALDKCATLLENFGLKDLYNSMIYQLAVSTRLVDLELSDNLLKIKDIIQVKYQYQSVIKYEEDFDDVPFCEIINEEEGKSLTVSKKAILLGKNLKAQLSLILLFRMIKLNTHENFVDIEIWKCILRVLFVLYESKMIDPDIFRAFQKYNKLPRLPKPHAYNTINKKSHEEGKKNKSGFFTAVASYLRNDDLEPTDEEIEIAEIAFNTIEAAEVEETIRENQNNYKDMVFLNLIFETLNKISNSVENESLRLFLLEILVALSINLETKDNKINRIYELLDIKHLTNNSKSFTLRVLIYKLEILKIDPSNIKNLIDELLTSNKIYDDDFYGVKSIGTEALKKILFIVNEDDILIMKHENFWRLIRKFSTFSKNCGMIYDFLSKMHDLKKFNHIGSNNYMLLLGLLDEISSKGSVGVKMEHEEDKAIVEISKKTIKLTEDLIQYIDFEANDDTLESSEQLFALIQAITHQCMNPYKPIREYAQSVLNNIINSKDTQLEYKKHLELNNFANSAISPLLDSLDDIDEKVNILVILKTFYLDQYLENKHLDHTNYPTILHIFNKHNSGNDAVEKLLQDLITEKNEMSA